MKCGERLVQKGGYEEGLARVEEAHPVTWGRKSFSMYCAHCPVMEILDIEDTGDFNATRIVSDPMGKEHCRFAFYKNPRDFPENFYARIGKNKPVKNR